MRLKIIHTNDIHSNFENFTRAVTLLRELKDEHTIVLDGGDFADFKSIELQGTRGIAALELLEAAGYDALTVGNNEMFNGIDTLEYMAANSSVPFISNNLVKKDRTPIQGIAKSIILHKNGIRILITGSSPDLGVFNDGLGVHMADFAESARAEIGRRQGSYDVCVLLSHIGTDADAELAALIPEIDVIISAHDHKLYAQAKNLNGTIMNSAGKYGEHVGITELDIEDGKVTLVHSETVPTRNAQPDAEILGILQTNKTKAITELSKPLYTISDPLWHDVIEENPLTNLIADGLRDMMACDIGLINSGIANAGLFGYISRKKLIEVCPSPLNPTAFNVTGSELRTALTESLDAQVCLADGRGPGFRGKFVGRLHVSGAEIIHNGQEVQEIFIGGEPLDDSRLYRVASSDYLQRGSGYPSLASDRDAEYRAEEIKDVIERYASKSDYIKRASASRWKQPETAAAE